MNENCIFESRELTKRYVAGKDALKSVSIKLEPGRIVGLLGPNGSGKTTLIKLACGLLTPTSGEVLICGMKPSPETKKLVAYLPDRDFLPQWMTVEQTIEYYGDFFEDFRAERAEQMVSDLGIDPDLKLKALSKGNREKVSLILTMARAAKLYLLDEPIAGVDPAARDYILRTILTNYAEDSVVMISTHLIADIESVLNDVIFIKEGSIELFRSAEEIRESEGLSVDALFREVYKW